MRNPSPPRKTRPSATVKSPGKARKTLEVPPSALADVPYERLDGRRLRATGRVVNFGTRVTPEFRGRVLRLAKQHHLLIVEVLERALDAFESQLR